MPQAKIGPNHDIILPKKVWSQLKRSVGDQSEITVKTEDQILLQKKSSKEQGAKKKPRNLTSKERRDSLYLPLEERRKILEQEAKELAPYYESDTEWRAWGEGDIIEA